MKTEQVIYKLAYYIWSRSLLITPTSWVTRHPCMELAPHITRFPTSSVDTLSVIGSERYAPILSKRSIKTKVKQPNE